jgi:hypothetical protein
MIRRAPILILATLAFPAAASASPVNQYVLKHPKREHCKAHYVKKVERVKVHGHRVKETLCIYRAPKPAPAPTPAPAPAPAPTITDVEAFRGESFPFHFIVSGSVKALYGTDLIGVPIMYTVTNQSTGQPLASFTEPSDPVQPCAIVYSVEGNTQTFAGQSVPPYAGCPFATVNVPTGQIVVLTGSFAGNSTYAPSVSGEQRTL